MMAVIDHNNPHLIPDLHLPDELIANCIFPKLPIKSLIRFKSVCKGWNSIISSPDFARLYLKQSAFSNKNQHLLINHKTCFLSFEYEGYGDGGGITSQTNWDCSPFSDEGDIIDSKGGLARIIMSSFHAQNHRIFVVGSCDGLVCLDAGSCLYVWNPITLEHRQIPYPQLPNKHDGVWGFGYVSSTSDYKLVRICQNRSNNEKQIEVFSLMDNAWKSSQEDIDGYGDCPRLSGSGLSVNDVTYWTMSKAHHRWCIIGIDIVMNKVKKVPLPKWQSGDFEFAPLMYVKEGCLCACWPTNEQVVEVGMLKHDGGVSSWTKLLQVTHIYHLVCRMTYYHHRHMPGIINESRFVFHVTKETLVLIDPHEKTPKYVPRLKIPSSRNVVHYTESLISPFCLKSTLC